MQFDDVNIGGQLIVGTGVCPAIKAGAQAINGSVLAEGPVVLGGQGWVSTYSTEWASRGSPKP